MTRHILLMKLKQGTSEEDRAECLKRMKALPAQIPFAKHYEAGMNLLHEDTSWDLAQIFMLGNKEQIFEFRTHPAHMEAVKYVSKFLEQMAGVDFECDPG